MSHSYRDLFVWQKSMALVMMMYEETRSFSQERVIRANIANEASGGFDPL